MLPAGDPRSRPRGAPVPAAAPAPGPRGAALPGGGGGPAPPARSRQRRPMGGRPPRTGLFRAKLQSPGRARAAAAGRSRGTGLQHRHAGESRRAGPPAPSRRGTGSGRWCREGEDGGGGAGAGGVPPPPPAASVPGALRGAARSGSAAPGPVTAAGARCAGPLLPAAPARGGSPRGVSAPVPVGGTRRWGGACGSGTDPPAPESGPREAGGGCDREGWRPVVPVSGGAGRGIAPLGFRG